MFWLSFRQFRLQAELAGALLVGLAVVVMTTHGNATTSLQMGQWLTGLILVVPGLVGVFWGAPLIARELESGTFRLAWTQSVSRARWTLCKLGLLGVAAVAIAGLCSLLVTWWSSSLDLAAGTGPFAHFDSRGIVPIGYAAFAFALGVAAGALIRNTVAAMGATLVVFAGVRVAFSQWVRPHLMSPLVARTPFTITTPRHIQVGGHLPHGVWIVSQSIFTRAGRSVGGPPGLFSGQIAVGPSGVTIGGVGSCPNLRAPTPPLSDSQGVNTFVARCINQLHLTNVTTYQPASRYWPFQIEETLIFVALALGVAALTVWFVRRLN